jgi:hypothetical protein
MVSEEMIQKVIDIMSNEEHVKNSIDNMTPSNKEELIIAIKHAIKAHNNNNLGDKPSKVQNNNSTLNDEERLVIVHYLNNDYINDNHALYTSGEVEDIIILFVRIINNPDLFNILKHVTTYKPKYDIINSWNISKRIDKDNKIPLENENEIKKIILCSFIEDSLTGNNNILPDDESYKNLKTSIDTYIDKNIEEEDHPIIDKLLTVQPDLFNDDDEKKKKIYTLLYILHNIPVDELLKILNKLKNN